jgi:hypothetical protein
LADFSAFNFNYKKGEYETFENSSKNDFGIRTEAAQKYDFGF